MGMELWLRICVDCLQAATLGAKAFDSIIYQDSGKVTLPIIPSMVCLLQKYATMHQEDHTNDRRRIYMGLFRVAVFFSSLGFLDDAGELLRFLEQTMEIVQPNASLQKAVVLDMYLLYSKRVELENHLGISAIDRFGLRFPVLPPINPTSAPVHEELLMEGM